MLEREEKKGGVERELGEYVERERENEMASVEMWKLRLVKGDRD